MHIIYIAHIYSMVCDTVHNDHTFKLPFSSRRHSCGIEIHGCMQHNKSYGI